MALQGPTQKAQGLHRSAPRPLYIATVWLLAWYSWEAPNNGSACISDPFACCWDSFPPIRRPCPASIWGLLPCLIVSCFVLFGCQLLEVCSFLKRKQRRSESEGEGRWRGQLEGVEGGETLVGMYCMGDKSIFNKKEKNSNIVEHKTFYHAKWLFYQEEYDWMCFDNFENLYLIIHDTLIWKYSSKFNFFIIICGF